MSKKAIPSGQEAASRPRPSSEGAERHVTVVISTVMTATFDLTHDLVDGAILTDSEVEDAATETWRRFIEDEWVDDNPALVSTLDSIQTTVTSRPL